MGRLSCTNFLYKCSNYAYRLPTISSPSHHRTFHGFYCYPQLFENSIAAESDSTKFYDEGVIHIVFEIVLSNLKEFDKLIPMLGSIHTAKVVEHCIGKYLRGSAVEDAHIETGVFGVKAVESMMNGSHYIRSLGTIIILADALNTLTWETFSENK